MLKTSQTKSQTTIKHAENITCCETVFAGDLFIPYPSWANAYVKEVVDMYLFMVNTIQ